MQWSDVEYYDKHVLVKVRRAKATGPVVSVPFVINAPFMVALMVMYRDCFAPDARQGRFFRHLVQRRDGKLVGVSKVAGEKTIAAASKDMAGWMGKPNPDDYTSHSMRRMGATFLANGGVTQPMLRLAGGWRSDTAAERCVLLLHSLIFHSFNTQPANFRYIDNATTNRMAIADTMGFGQGDRENVPPRGSLATAFEAPAPRFAAPGRAAAAQEYRAVLLPVVNNVGAAYNAQVGLIPGPPPAPRVIPADRDPALVIDFNRYRVRSPSPAPSQDF